MSSSLLHGASGRSPESVRRTASSSIPGVQRKRSTMRRLCAAVARSTPGSLPCALRGWMLAAALTTCSAKVCAHSGVKASPTALSARRAVMALAVRSCVHWFVPWMLSAAEPYSMRPWTSLNTWPSGTCRPPSYAVLSGCLGWPWCPHFARCIGPVFLGRGQPSSGCLGGLARLGWIRQDWALFRGCWEPWGGLERPYGVPGSTMLRNAHACSQCCESPQGAPLAHCGAAQEVAGRNWFLSGRLRNGFPESGFPEPVSETGFWEVVFCSARNGFPESGF